MIFRTDHHRPALPTDLAFLRPPFKPKTPPPLPLSYFPTAITSTATLNRSSIPALPPSKPQPKLTTSTTLALSFRPYHHRSNSLTSSKRSRSAFDVDDLCIPAFPRKKRRLRLDLITSRLSQPYATPSTHIPSPYSTLRPALWRVRNRVTIERNRPLLRKAAILNSLRLKGFKIVRPGGVGVGGGGGLAFLGVRQALRLKNNFGRHPGSGADPGGGGGGGSESSLDGGPEVGGGICTGCTSGGSGSGTPIRKSIESNNGIGGGGGCGLGKPRFVGELRFRGVSDYDKLDMGGDPYTEDGELECDMVYSDFNERIGEDLPMDDESVYWST
ncbi:hypothetical protein MMC25_002598 [Agyrium rufum]|nr:hypothetical protein [Agyrium rufum]